MPVQPQDILRQSKRIAIVGAGMAGVVCARTLMQAGHAVQVFEKSHAASGRLATRQTPWGSFDHGAQYFTVRDARFKRALATVPGLAQPWRSGPWVRLDAAGQVLAAPNTAARDTHWCATPGMSALVRTWAKPLGDEGMLHLNTRVVRLERDMAHDSGWQLVTVPGDGTQHSTVAGFDAVLLALPAPQAAQLLHTAAPAGETLVQSLKKVEMAPCWTLMLAWPNADPAQRFGPRWHAVRSDHHRIAWAARESSKPGRGAVQRFTVQASPAWSQEHLEDDADTVVAKLSRAFSDLSGIRAEATHAVAHRWRYAKTIKPLGTSHQWLRGAGLGVCGDWCLGHRVEDAFVSGLELALAVTG
jgi:renalase